MGKRKKKTTSTSQNGSESVLNNNKNNKNQYLTNQHDLLSMVNQNPINLFQVDSNEVDEVIMTDIVQDLMDPEFIFSDTWNDQKRGWIMHKPFWQFNDTKIWGVTAVILAEFAARLRKNTKNKK
eukprot:gb/GECH01005235.1/.p1 GENE.gb/GECH01005235.1/~~gb/GECH01005235.1/.p1  ORF type:complete len:124 (+),score=39.37 gb/GECH01005235.1/:1-372(+)